ncbi:MAG: ABC transporter permease [Chloroflexi bacterium]|nr:MAG: ABC transporter permease [Chloroflexota bacterium]
MLARARHSATNVGELMLVFRAALRGAARRPFYWQEFLEQCRFILMANFIPLLLTGVGWGIIVSLEAGHFFRAASGEWRLGGFTVMANIREFSPVATGLMIAAVSGTGPGRPPGPAGARGPERDGAFQCALHRRPQGARSDGHDRPLQPAHDHLHDRVGLLYRGGRCRREPGRVSRQLLDPGQPGGPVRWRIEMHHLRSSGRGHLHI